MNESVTTPLEAAPVIQRRNLRFPAQESALVSLTDAEGRNIYGAIENESYSGIAVRVPADAALATGMPVSVVYYGHPMPGTVRRVATGDSAGTLVGIEWT